MKLYKRVISIIIVLLMILNCTNVFADVESGLRRPDKQQNIPNLPTTDEEMKQVIENRIQNGQATGTIGDTPTASSTHTPDEIINEANSFIEKGQNGQKTIDVDNLKKGSDTLYNILLSIGIFLAVAIGMYLGIKFMLASAEDKAKVKEALIPYIAGCVVIFGAFVIWKLVIMLFGGMA